MTIAKKPNQPELALLPSCPELPYLIRQRHLAAGMPGSALRPAGPAQPGCTSARTGFRSPIEATHKKR